MLRNHLLFWNSHTRSSPEAFRAGLSLSPIVSDSLGHKEHSSNSSQGSRAPRHGLEPSQTRHWYYTAPPFYVLEIFSFFFNLLKSGSFFVLFLSICVSFQFFFNSAVVGKSSPWSTPTSIAEAFSQFLRSWPAWRKWKAVVLQGSLGSEWNARLSLCGSQPRALRGLLRCRLLLGASAGSPQQRQTCPPSKSRCFLVPS